MPARKTDPIEYRKRVILKMASTKASDRHSLTGNERKLAPVTLAKLKFMDEDDAADGTSIEE